VRRACSCRWAVADTRSSLLLNIKFPVQPTTPPHAMIHAATTRRKKDEQKSRDDSHLACVLITPPAVPCHLSRPSAVLARAALCPAHANRPAKSICICSLARSLAALCLYGSILGVKLSVACMTQDLSVCLPSPYISSRDRQPSQRQL
jgi:hypothetical protein